MTSAQTNTEPAGRTLHDFVVQASLSSYETQGSEAVPYWMTKANGHPVPDLYIPSLRRVEEIETDESLSQLSQDRIDDYRARGLEVWLLVPLEKLGEARSSLTGGGGRIQPWWITESRIYFGRPESL
jgi:hypothetical protein